VLGVVDAQRHLTVKWVLGHRPSFGGLGFSSGRAEGGERRAVLARRATGRPSAAKAQAASRVSAAAAESSRTKTLTVPPQVRLTDAPSSSVIP
jgi:hypothetical protein